MRDSRSDIETIKSRANIVDIISEYVALKKTGRNFSGLCPFHKEKTPSFSVNAEKQIFYCFGCGAGGDVFEFLTRMNNMSFPEALSFLADKTGVVLQEKPPGPAGPEKSLREDIKKINKMAGDYFTANLQGTPGRSARAYLQKRGVREETVRDFHLGLSLTGWRNLRDYFAAKRVSLPLVEKAGLVIKGEKGDHYDRFRGRLIFPISNLTGDIIAFGGRAAGDEKPKYLNSPESPVYTKGKNLYGLFQAKDEIRQKGFVILVEGYFDVLSLWNAGFHNVVAALGTALTREHLDLLRRFTNTIVAIFDPDEAGRSALERSLTLFLEEKFHARAVIVPDNLDPDDYIKAHGAEAMEKLIEGSQSMVDYYIDNVIGSRRGFEADLDAVRAAVPFISRIEDPVQKNLFTKRVAEKLNIDQSLLRSEITRVVSGKPRQAAAVTQSVARPDTRQSNRVELTMLRLIAEYPDFQVRGLHRDVIAYFQSPELQQLGHDLQRRILEGGAVKLSDLLTGIANEALRNRLLQWTVAENPFEDTTVESLYRDTAEKIKRDWFKAKQRALTLEQKRAESTGDTQRAIQIALEKDQLRKKEKESL